MMQSSVFFAYLITLSFSSRLQEPEWKGPMHGRYTRDINDYEIVVPRRLDHLGEFVSYALPQFFTKESSRGKRDIRRDTERVHYGVNLDGEEHVLELWPNHQLLSPGLVMETRGDGAARDLNKVQIRSVPDSRCHYVGWVQGLPGSRVALSLCDGMAGHIRTKRDHYYIEPLEDENPKEDGQHLHIVYQRSFKDMSGHKCGTGIKNGWKKAWNERVRSEYRISRGVDNGLPTGAPVPNKYSSAEGKNNLNNFLEILLVADKKFLQARNGTDFEQYLFTVMNMAYDIFHDESVGQPIDLVLVRVIYLEKEEQEIDLIINKDADATLTNFCKWSTRKNLALTHPNHHDIAVLVTKYDICLDGNDCGTAGLANLAGGCMANLSCAICEDTGLEVGTVIAHEIGHLLGADHDSDEEHPPPGECSGVIGHSIHVMASWSQLSPANWSVCSRAFITEFIEDGLGSCFLDEPQEHDFKMPQMPPGVVYDREWQCNDVFGPTKPCNLGQSKDCLHLTCAAIGTKVCKSAGPPADGTSCGTNKWCFEGKCVDVGVRPDAVNGQWGEWGSWSACSRTCGGGAQYMERKCDKPRPANKGRYCVGKRRKYRLCKKDPCDEGALIFREMQCKEHDTEELKWVPFNDHLPEHVCALVCSNNEGGFSILEPRVKDGTYCRRGSRDKCIAGKCRKVGCDYVLDSDAVEDICGVCNGDASTCDVIDKTYTESGEDYVKIVTIPKGCRHITVEEMKPSRNVLALAAADEKTFYLNGDYTIQADGEQKIAGTISIYTNVEPEQESLVIVGPIKEPLVLFLLNNMDPNPGIHYKYSCPSATSTYKPKFNWELIDWSRCSVFCGGGTQLSDPSCIEERGGLVAKKFCEKIPKPEVNTRVCNVQPCRIRWRIGEWGKCDGCVDKPGQRHRVVDCVKQSPFEDSEIITEDKECKNQRPANTEACTSNEPCEKSTKRHITREASSSAYYSEEDEECEDEDSNKLKEENNATGQQEGAEEEEEQEGATKEKEGLEKEEEEAGEDEEDGEEGAMQEKEVVKKEKKGAREEDEEDGAIQQKKGEGATEDKEGLEKEEEGASEDENDEEEGAAQEKEGEGATEEKEGLEKEEEGAREDEEDEEEEEGATQEKERVKKEKTRAREEEEEEDEKEGVEEEEKEAGGEKEEFKEAKHGKEKLREEKEEAIEDIGCDDKKDGKGKTNKDITVINKFDKLREEKEEAIEDIECDDKKDGKGKTNKDIKVINKFDKTKGLTTLNLNEKDKKDVQTECYEVKTRKEGLIVDRFNPDKIKILEFPMIEDSGNFNISDEAAEAVGDKIPSSVDTSKVKVITGEQVTKQLKKDKKLNEAKDKNEDESGKVVHC